MNRLQMSKRQQKLTMKAKKVAEVSIFAIVTSAFDNAGVDYFTMQRGDEMEWDAEYQETSKGLADFTKGVKVAKDWEFAIGLLSDEDVTFAYLLYDKKGRPLGKYHLASAKFYPNFKLEAKNG